MKTALIIAFLGLGEASLVGCGSESADHRGDSSGGARKSSPAKVAAPESMCLNCREEDPISPEGQTGVPGRPGDGPVVLGFFGGYTSCAANGNTPDPKEQRLADAFDAALAAVEETSDKETVTIRSCFTADAGKVHLVTSVEPDKTRSIDLANLAKELGSFLSSKVPGGRLRLVGHSYGGWTVMSLAKDLPASVTIDTLVTIDPISTRDCTPLDFLSGGAGCKRAPSDFGVDGLAAIKKRVGPWVNFYQTSDTVLFSSPTNGAENIRMDYPSAALGPHNAIIEDAQVIKKIAEVVAGKGP